MINKNNIIIKKIKVIFMINLENNGQNNKKTMKK
jgi:hypothetical protein